MKLLDLPQGTKMEVVFDKFGRLISTFHRIDGAYSYCTIDRTRPQQAGIFIEESFHLHFSTELYFEDDVWKLLSQKDIK